MVISIGRVWQGVRLEGVGATLRRLWTRVFGEDEWCIFVREVNPTGSGEPCVEINGVVVRDMTEADLPMVARHMPVELGFRSCAERIEALRRCLPDGVVGLRDEQLVGAAWFADAVGAEQEWWRAVSPHLDGPARLARGIFVIPGEKQATWAIVKQANGRLADRGVRSVVSVIRAANRPSILVNRMLGGHLRARKVDRYRWGACETRVEPEQDRSGLALRASRKQS